MLVCNIPESAYRRKEQDTPTLPRIPVQPIGYDEAEILLRNISPENPPPPAWIGDLNATYSLGPKLINLNWKMRLNVSTTNQKKMTYNTIGILRGLEEPGMLLLLPLYNLFKIFFKPIYKRSIRPVG